MIPETHSNQNKNYPPLSLAFRDASQFHNYHQNQEHSVIDWHWDGGLVEIRYSRYSQHSGFQAHEHLFGAQFAE